jgi:hypothetical protein
MSTAAMQPVVSRDGPAELYLPSCCGSMAAMEFSSAVLLESVINNQSRYPGAWHSRAKAMIKWSALILVASNISTVHHGGKHPESLGRHSELSSG